MPVSPLRLAAPSLRSCVVSSLRLFPFLSSRRPSIGCFIFRSLLSIYHNSPLPASSPALLLVLFSSEELWSMWEFLMPVIFETGDVDLKKLLNAEDRDLIGRMRSILGPFILRRTFIFLQIEYVRMEKQQQDAYNESIENYRASSQARMMKSSETCLHDVARILPRHQISNYFLEFRKIANHILLVRCIYSDDDVVHFAKILHPKGAFGFEYTVERVIEELKSYNDFSIHRLSILRLMRFGLQILRPRFFIFNGRAS